MEIYELSNPKKKWKDRKRLTVKKTKRRRKVKKFAESRKRR